MPLAPGTRLGPYEVVGPLGAGGMGEVMRARDSKLGREVALKILPEHFATDPDRLARLRREAQVLAALNHPHIGHIYGFEDDGTPALVLELVEGPTLADRLARGPLAIVEALSIARQIAGALEVAHEQGIVHRDLKPANVKIKDDGTVKVLDFGLAKALAPASSGAGAEAEAAPTLTAHNTNVGVVLGTAAYMAPEQAEGRAVDRRADIWAFGAVLYEMLSGRRAIRSEVLREDVDWAALPAKTPAFVRRLLARCLDRDVKRRLRDIGEARIVLEDSNPADTGAAPGKPRPLWRPAMVALGAFGAGAIAGSLWYSSREPPPPRNVTRFRFDLPEGQVFTGLSGRAVALSPDGTQLAYVANGRLYLRSLAEQDAKPIRGTEGLQAVADAVFSPDGRSLAFHAVYDQTLKRIAVTGGAAVTIARAELPSGIDWGPDGIVYGQGAKGILRVSPDGGAPETLVRVKDGEFAHGPQLLPDGRHVLFTLVAGPSPDSRSALVVVQTLTSGERKTLVNGGADARYVRSGHLVYALGGNLLAVPFDARRLEVAGSPVPVVEGVRRAVGGVASNFTVSGSGSLAYVPGPATASGAADLDLAVIDRKGGLRPLKLPPGTYSVPRVSPDGTRVAFGTVDGTEATISTYSLSGTSAIRRVTFGSNNRFPVWTSDSTRITFQSDRDGDQAIYWQRVDGAGTAERLTTPDPGTSHEPESWSPDGAFLLYNVTKDSDVSLSSFSLRDRKSKPFGDVHSLTRTNAVFSPDGRWVAYASTEQGRSRTLVSPFPPTGAGHQLPAEYAHQPLWAPSGKELFFNPRPGALAAVSVSTSPTLAFGFPVEFTRLFQTGPPTVRRAFDITPGGQFVGLIGAGAAESEMRQMNSQVRIVLNWLEELKQRVPW